MTIFLLCAFLIATPAAADWPQWRGDAGRSGATEAAGPEKPGLLWTLALDRPDPAYDHQYRMCADAAYAPIAAGGLVFMPSNVTDGLAAHDLQNGQARWRFFTEGPVRFAPVYRDGRVYFGSDDGYLYCAAAATGKMLWKVRGAPEALPDSRLIVNGRLCSRWPVRGGPVERGGVVYFGAGIWPEEGVYVCAVDAATGGVLWRSDGLSCIKNGMTDHGVTYDLSLPPQGYLALIDGKLAVPSGRALAAWFDPASGALEPYTCYYVKYSPPRGTWNVLGIGRTCVQGGNWFGTRPDALAPVPPALKEASTGLSSSRLNLENERYVTEHRPFFHTDTYNLHKENLYCDPVLTPSTVYVSEFADENKYLVERGHTAVTYPAFDRIVARDLTRPQWVRAARGGMNAEVPLRKMEFPLLWELQTPLRVLIKAGNRLYAGGEGTIAAIALPEGGEKPGIAWQAAVDGVPVNALVAGGKLVVSTSTGRVYCFGDGAGQAPEQAGMPALQKGPWACPAKGFALVLGWGDGQRAAALGRGGEYRVVVLEPDADLATQARGALAEQGLYGLRVQVIQAGPDKLSLTPYWASLVLADSLKTFGPALEAACAVALDALRPYGGKLLAPESGEGAAVLKRLVTAGRPGYELGSEKGRLAVCRTAPPPGAADWTHEAAGADNTWASADALVKAPLGLLWYSGDVDRYFTPLMELPKSAGFQHARNPYPLVVQGRMFIIALDVLHAIDIYTGNHLWKTELPLTPWVQTRFEDSRIYGRPVERNYVAAADLVYTIDEREIRAYDTATGKEKAVIALPKEIEARDAKARWTEVRLWRNMLFAVLGRTLIALDRHSGKVLWTRPSTRETTTCAIGGDTLFGLDYSLSGNQSGPPAEKMDGEMFALRADAGTPLWNQGVQYSPISNTPPLPRPWLLPTIPLLSYNAKHQLLVMTVNRNGVQVFKGGDGSRVWAESMPGNAGDIQAIYEPVVTDDELLISNPRGFGFYLYDIQTGKKAGENTGINRIRGCGRPIGNSNLLTYRDSATEMYDIAGNRTIEFNSVRAGCTASFLPAGGVIAAPMLGHGCVCNYPMFASLGLVHLPAAEGFRPAAVKASWTNKFVAEEPKAPRQKAAKISRKNARKKR